MHFSMLDQLYLLLDSCIDLHDEDDTTVTLNFSPFYNELKEILKMLRRHQLVILQCSKRHPWDGKLQLPEFVLKHQSKLF